MNIVFFGTPDFATTFLAALHADKDISVQAVVCQPDKPAGRKQTITPPSTKIFAQDQNIPVLQPEKKKDLLPALKNLGNIDAFVIVAYGMIIPQAVLDIPEHGSINVHPSLLPKYRGPSPIQAAIANQNDKTGISIMLIDDQMDHGPILAQTPMSIEATDDSESMMKKAGDIGAPLLVETMKNYVAGNVTPQEQDHDAATYCKMIKKEDGLIDWTRPAKEIDAQIRAYRPWPGTFTKLDGKLFKIHVAKLVNEDLDLKPGEIKVLDNHLLVGTGSVPLELFQVQIEGKGRQFAANFLNGHSDLDGKLCKEEA